MSQFDGCKEYAKHRESRQHLYATDRPMIQSIGFVAFWVDSANDGYCLPASWAKSPQVAASFLTRTSSILQPRKS